jgi:long-chain acyl-CoA synthetase
MLYDTWRQVARALANEIALRELASGRQWTFRELALEAEHQADDLPPMVLPQGISADFILDVLRAWRAGRPVCPLEPGQPAPELPPGLPEGIVHLKTTSASTGEARLIAFTAAQLAADAANIVTTMGLRTDLPNLGVISLAHSYGFSNLVLPLLLQGIPLTLVAAPLPEIVKRAAATVHGGITLAAVPALWRTWHEADSIPANVRLAISAGAPLPLALEQNVFASRGLKIHNFYGSSECGGIAYDASPGPRLDAACAGAPMCNVQLSVASDGCLEVRSRAVGETYWPQPEPNLAGGVFHTSDLAEIAYDLVYLRGRAGDQINVAGRKISPEAIEKALRANPAVRECVVFGVTSAAAGRGDDIVACVAATGKASAESLRQFLLSRIPAWQIPREWWLIDSLAPNERGKLSRAEWRKRFLERK